MTTISIPISTELNEYINEQVRLGKASSKAELIRRALTQFKQEDFLNTIRQAEQEVRDGKVFTGDLDKLAKGFE